MENQASETITVDVLVVGAGVGGLSAAMSAGLDGLNVLIAEKTSCFGGTGARSGALLWVPLNYLSVRNGIADSIAEARRLCRGRGRRHVQPRCRRLLPRHAPRMVETYAKHFPMMQFVCNDVSRLQ